MIHSFVNPKQGGLHLVWIDDRFFVENGIANKLLRKFDAEIASSMNQRWIDTVQYNQDPEDTLVNLALQEFAKYGQKFKSICDDLGYGFSVTNFSYLNSNTEMMSDSNCRFLVDVQNILVEEEEQRSEIDRDWPSDIYGAYFVKHWAIPRENYRFFSRYTYEKKQIPKVANVIGISEHDAHALYVVAQTGCERQVKEWLELGVLHEIPGIRCALKFYSLPWLDNWSQRFCCHWSHRALESRDNKYYKILDKWLNLEVDMESAKCLVIWNLDQHDNKAQHPWEYQTETFYNGRAIKGKVLNAVVQKLGIQPIDNVLEDMEYRTPICPALPFFVSLRDFQEQLSPEQMTMDRYEGHMGELYTLTIHLKEKIMEDGEEKTIDQYGVAKAYFKLLDQKPETTGHYYGLARSLIDLQHCRTTYMKLPVDNPEWIRAFRGEGLPCPCVGVLFGPRSIQLVWTGRTG